MGKPDHEDEGLDEYFRTGEAARDQLRDVAEVLSLRWIAHVWQFHGSQLHDRHSRRADEESRARADEGSRLSYVAGLLAGACEEVLHDVPPPPPSLSEEGLREASRALGPQVGDPGRPASDYVAYSMVVEALEMLGLHDALVTLRDYYAPWTYYVSDTDICDRVGRHVWEETWPPKTTAPHLLGVPSRERMRAQQKAARDYQTAKERERRAQERAELRRRLAEEAETNRAQREARRRERAADKKTARQRLKDEARAAGTAHLRTVFGTSVDEGGA